MKKEFELVPDFNETLPDTIIEKEEEKPSNLVQFNMDRLVKEVDTLYQEMETRNTEIFNEHCDSTMSTKEDIFRQDLELSLNQYEERITQVVRDHKSDLIQEIARGRTLITLTTGQEIGVGHLDHPEMESVIKTLMLQHKAMLVGPAGTGKTTMIAQIAKKVDLPFYKYSCSRDSSVFDLIGYKQPTSEQYLETTFLKCYEEGGIFLVDEYDAMSGDMSLFFNGVSDNSGFISIPHRDAKPTATKHKDFYIVMCGNTWGKGSHEFTGRDFQDAALMDRFRYSRHHIGYHHELEIHLSGDNYGFIIQLRKALEEVGSYLSTRNVEDIAIMLSSGSSKEDIIKMSTADLTETDRTLITEKVVIAGHGSNTRRSALMNDSSGVEWSLISPSNSGTTQGVRTVSSSNVRQF